VIGTRKRVESDWHMTREGRGDLGISSLPMTQSEWKERSEVSHLGSLGVRGKILKFIKALYRSSTARVRVGTRETEAFSLDRGVRQGCPMSPTLFEIFIEDLSESLRTHGITVPGLREIVASLLFADDVAILAESAQQLKSLLTVCQDVLFRYT
jgi:hypothetical protein